MAKAPRRAKSTKAAKGVTRAKAVKKAVTVKDLSPEKGTITRSAATSIRRRMP